LAGGGFGRAQPAQDHAPDAARHRVGAALVEARIDEQHRDNAQKRGAVAVDRRGAVHRVPSPRSEDGRRIRQAEGAVDK